MSFLSQLATTISIDKLGKVLEQIEKSLCKINLPNTLGTGFFCKINFPDESNFLPVLITTNHLLNEDSISEGKTITISLNKDKLSYKITIDNNRRKYTSSIYDITMIEILPKDNFDYISFLNLDRGILENKSIHIYEKEPIYLIQYSRGKGMYSTGNIKNINDNIYNFGHLCTPKPGAEGSPILNLNSLEVIGVHIGEDPKLNCNKGTFINKPIEEFNLKYKKK